jgi:uncharacterized protein YggU (UPF0235/DUF167 family)
MSEASSTLIVRRTLELAGESFLECGISVVVVLRHQHPRPRSWMKRELTPEAGATSLNKRQGNPGPRAARSSAGTTVRSIRVAAPPQDGRAAPRSRLCSPRRWAYARWRVSAGHGSARKRVEIEGIDRAALERRLATAGFSLVASGGAAD